MHQKLQLPSGAELEVQHPFAMLCHARRHSATLSRLVARKHSAAPSSPARPWGICLYADEILPGNQLAHKSSRKMWGVYWSFLEFAEALSDEDRHGKLLHAGVHMHGQMANMVVAMSHAYQRV